jgi:hypothetical protein
MVSLIIHPLTLDFGLGAAVGLFAARGFRPIPEVLTGFMADSRRIRFPSWVATSFKKGQASDSRAFFACAMDHAFASPNQGWTR